MQADMAGAREIKCFRSRRNRVTLNEMERDNHILPVILKEYQDADAAQREYRLLRRLGNLNIKVPAIYGINENVIYLQYIGGALLTDIIDDVSSYPPGWIAALAGWFYELHRTGAREDGSVLLKDDVNLRNFIFFENNFYALDFEAEIYGRPEQDVAECCAYILSNDLSFTEEKFEVVNKFIDSYCRLDNTANKSVVRKEIKKSLKVLAGYRQQQEAEILDSLPLVDLMVI
jgi:tRNA A-37 threonylcarbamoyl transferase component Bud32